MDIRKDILVPPTTTILKVIEAIDAGSIQIALVIDAKNRLLGTVTYGDIRRGILKGISLNDPVVHVMKRNPITARSDESQENIFTLMKQRKIRQIPVVDSTGRVVGIEILDRLLQPQNEGSWVVLMAGGLGSRLRPLTDDCPKPLLKVGDRPLLETILENFTAQGFRRFFLAVNYKDDMVQGYFGDGSRWGIEIQYIREEQQLGTAGALGLMTVKPSEPLLVMNADLLTKVNFRQLLDFHKEHQAKATMCVREYTFQVPFGVVKIEKHQVASINEKPIQRFFVNAGIYVLEPEVLELISRNEALDMPSLFHKLVDRNETVAAFPIREYWLDIGRMEDLVKANGEIAEILK